jgi:hypothetical protein
MDGLTLLRRAHHAGLAVVAEGDKLVIRGPKRAEPVVRLLIEHKPDVLAALAATEQGSQQWRDRYAVRISHWFSRGHWPRQEAEALAYAELMNEWHTCNGLRCPQSQCAGCGEPIAGRTALTLSDNNCVHLDGFDCLLLYGQLWRGAAIAALRRLGLDPPPEFEIMEPVTTNP